MKQAEIKNTDRRTFVKNSALASAALMASSMPIHSFGYTADDQTLKLALIGCGGRGTGAAVQALTADKDVELVAMADAFEDRLEKSLSGIIEHFEDERTINVPKENQFVGFDAYKKAIDKADVVILATPPGFRPLQFEYAIDNGKHVFMEKPVATDPAGVRKVLAAAKKAKENNLNVVVGLQRRYENKYIALFDEIQKGTLGKIVAGQIYWNGGGVWVRPRKSGQTEMEYQMRNWYYFNWLCGDHILEQHIHNIDIANWFVQEYPSSAQGMGGRQMRHGKDHGEIFDHHFVEYTYPSGAVISSQCRHQKGCFNRVDEYFQGTKGQLFAGNGEIKDFQDGILASVKKDGDPNPYQVEHDRLFNAIRTGDHVLADAEYGAYSTLTAIMGRMATYSGQVITWDQALNSDMSLVPDNLSWTSNPPTMPDQDGKYPIPQPGVTKYS